MTGSNRTSVLVGPRRSEVRSEVMPECGAGQVLIRVLVNGVCASDLPDWQAGPSVGVLRLGHEPVGEVVAVGIGVESCAVGDIVTGRVDHSFCEFALADEPDLVPVPAGLHPEAVLGEPLGCVVEAVRRSRLDVGDRVAVIGTGYMGLCLLQLLRRGWLYEVVAIDPRDDARDHALEHGADRAVDPDEAGQAGEFDVVFEASGSAAGLNIATGLVREHGTLSLVGYHQGQRTVDMASWNVKAIDVVNAHVRDRARLCNSVRRGLHLVAAGHIDIRSLITHRFVLSDVDDAYAALTNKPDGYVKAIITVA
jgi:threonine dehydrogenase-like Zn-dependent dehydrogenase